MRYRIILEFSSRLFYDDIIGSNEDQKENHKKEVERIIKGITKKLPRHSLIEIGNELNKTYYDEKEKYFFFDFEMDYSISPECSLDQDIFPTDYPKIWEPPDVIHEPTIITVCSRFVSIDIS